MRLSALSLPQDAALPQLACVLDAERMAAVFAAQLQAGAVSLRGCMVERVKYRAQRNLSVAYVLALHDARGPFSQRVSARVCSGGDSARRHASVAARPWQASRAGPSISQVPALDLAAHWWPNDARLAAGAVLADAHALQQRFLPAVAAALDGGPCGVHRQQLVQLVPEQRVTVRVDLLAQPAGPARTIYAKADVEGRGAVTQAVMHELWHSPARRAGRLLLPRPLLWQPASGLHWQAAVPGRALLDAQPVPHADTAAAVGRLLAALHHSPAAAAPAVTMPGLRRQLQATHALLCTVQPALAVQAGRVAALLADGLSHISEGTTDVCTLHGDLHPRNLMLDDAAGLSLIDLDSVHRGPALLDLGAWLADGLYRARLAGGSAPIDTGLDDGAGAAGRRAFLSGYVQGGGQRCSWRAIAWATAWQLWCQRLWRCMVNLKPGRFALVPALLVQTHALLAGPQALSPQALEQAA